MRGVRPAENAVVVATGEGMTTGALTLVEVSFVSGTAPRSFEASVMTRYRGPEAAAVVEQGPGERWTVRFEEPQRVVAPGQAAVFYRGDEVLGGGTVVAA